MKGNNMIIWEVTDYGGGKDYSDAENWKVVDWERHSTYYGSKKEALKAIRNARWKPKDEDFPTIKKLILTKKRDVLLALNCAH